MRLLKVKEARITLDSSRRLYQLNIPIIAVTGGIATGKTTVCLKLEQLGAPLINADHLVKKIYQTQDALTFVKQNCPSAVVADAIQFPILRQAVFQNTDLKQDIESFIYPRMREHFLDSIPVGATFVVYDVPLLFERSLESSVDCNILVYAPRSVQTPRLMARDQISAELANKILDSQMDIELKRQRAQFVLDNSGDQRDLDINFQALASQIWD